MFLTFTFTFQVLLTPRSVQFKVQQRVLKTLAVLTTYLKFHDRDLYRIIGASYKYLHKYVQIFIEHEPLNGDCEFA